MKLYPSACVGIIKLLLLWNTYRSSCVCMSRVVCITHLNSRMKYSLGCCRRGVIWNYTTAGIPAAAAISRRWLLKKRTIGPATAPGSTTTACRLACRCQHRSSWPIKRGGYRQRSAAAQAAMGDGCCTDDTRVAVGTATLAAACSCCCCCWSSHHLGWDGILPAVERHLAGLILPIPTRAAGNGESRARSHFFGPHLYPCIGKKPAHPQPLRSQRHGRLVVVLPLPSLVDAGDFFFLRRRGTRTELRLNSVSQRLWSTGYPPTPT